MPGGSESRAQACPNATICGPEAGPRHAALPNPANGGEEAPLALVVEVILTSPCMFH